jgi:metal-sulfur cluster biosynthetic enzyme
MPLSSSIKLSKTDILPYLEQVIDSEFGINIVDLGFIHELSICQHNVATLYLTLAATNEIKIDLLINQIRSKLEQIPHIGGVDIEIVHSPAWSHHKMSASARKQSGLIFFGGSHE